MSTDFDSWAGNFHEPKNISSNKDGEIWGAPYFEKMMKVIQNNGDIEEFIKQKNQDLHDRYIEESTSSYRKTIAENNEKKSNLQKFSTEFKEVNSILDEYEKDIATLMQHYPNPNHQNCIKELLFSYKRDDGKFEKGASYQELTQKPQGFINKIFQGKKNKQAKEYLDAFINKYEKLNISEKLSKLSDQDRYTNNLKNKFEAISNINPQLESYYSKEVQRDYQLVNEEIQAIQQNIKSNEESIQYREKAFTESARIPQEDSIIRSFCNEIRDEIKHPKSLNSSDYIECLDKLPDNEVIMFNIGLTSGRDVENKIKNIMNYNGLQCGSETSQWLIRKETRDNSDNGKYEIFSPLMTVKDAKEVMPKLMADLDRSHISSGLAIPINASDLFKEQSQNEVQPEITQDSLMKVVGGAWIKQQMQSGNPLFNHQEKMKLIGIESEQELPQVFNSLEELKSQYPKEQFLFSGSTASDDHLALSARVGRNGIIYATPDISYAAKYDGVTNVGSAYEGVTATGDKYVSSIVGQLSDQDVKVGFINIYEQNEADKYFPNFGMEDYRKKINSDTQPQSFDIYEPSPNGFVDLHRQAQTASNGSLTRDQAINGYIGRSAPYEKDGKTYMPLSYDAETYVTPGKNPLKAKIMHITWNGNEFFIPVSNNPNEAMQTILNKRQAKMEDTFSHNGRQDVLARIQKQKEEFKQGVIPQIRENDFIQKQQAQLNTNENKTSTPQQQSKNISEKTSKPIPIGKQIELLRGAIPQPKAPVKETTLDTSNVVSKQTTRV